MKKTAIVIALLVGLIVTAFQLYNINHRFGQVEILTLSILALFIAVIVYFVSRRKTH